MRFFRVLFFIIGLSLSFSGLAQADVIPSSNDTLTTSTSSSDRFTDVLLPEERIDTFFTHLTGSINGGPTLVEFNFDLQYSDPAVQAAIAQVHDALNGIANPQILTFTDPVLLSNLETLQNSQTNFLGEQFNHFVQTFTLEDTIGPGTIVIGDRDNGGTAFDVLAGTANLNVNTHTENFIDRQYQNQNTYLTSQHYEIAGNFQPAPVPEPASALLLGIGLLGAGLRKRWKKNNSCKHA